LRKEAQMKGNKKNDETKKALLLLHFKAQKTPFEKGVSAQDWIRKLLVFNVLLKMFVLLFSK